jgi:hypothetical protein
MKRPTLKQTLRGFRASEIVIQDVLNAAAKRLPKNRWKRKKNADYWSGVFDAAVLADAILALGFNPSSLVNQERIDEIIKQREETLKRELP